MNSSEPLRKRTYFLTREKIVVGRKEDDGNDIVVSKKSVSRKHATIRISETSFNAETFDSDLRLRWKIIRPLELQSMESI